MVLDGNFDTKYFAAELGHDFRRLPDPITRSPLYPLTDVRTAPTLIYVRVRRERSPSSAAAPR